jgi:copper chaperone
MTTLSIPDMSCRHCEASVLAALAPLAEGVTVDLATRTAALTTKAPPEALIAALDQIGFPASILAV